MEERNRRDLLRIIGEDTDNKIHLLMEFTNNKKDIEIDETAIVRSSLHLPYDIDMKNKYKVMGGKNYITVTSKKSGVSRLVNFPDVTDYAFYAVEDCYIEFYIVDGNIGSNNYLEYNFNMPPNYQNFSLQDGTIKIDSDIKRIYIDAQAGLLVSFRKEHGDAYAECINPVITNKDKMIYTGNLAVRQMQIREYVRNEYGGADLLYYEESDKSMLYHFKDRQFGFEYDVISRITPVKLDNTIFGYEETKETNFLENYKRK